MSMCPELTEIIERQELEIDKLRARIVAAYNEGIEAAAKVADARDLSIMSSTLVDVEARKIAASIRALLKDKPHG